MFRSLTDTISVSEQISLEDCEAAAKQGFGLIVNNRPDGEDPAAPQGAEIAEKARILGMDYVAIPVTHAGFSHTQIEAMKDALGSHGETKVLAYCRSGTRSTLLWALTCAANGENPEDLQARARNAGYDLTPVMAMMQALSGQS